MSERLTTLINQSNFLVTDLDGTQVVNGVPHDEFGLLDVDGYNKIEKKNISSLINLAKKGHPTNIITARGLSAVPLARYLSNALDKDITPNGRPIVFNFAESNGAWAIDILRHNVICDASIPFSFYESFEKHPEIANILRRSTPNETLELTQRVTPNEWREGFPGLIYDFALLYPMSHKVNLHLKAEMIRANPGLAKDWESVTGVKIKRQKDVRTALDVLNSKLDWGVNIAGFSLNPTYDLTAAYVTKYWCMLQLWDYTKALNSDYGIEIDSELRPICIVDNPDGNDQTIARIPGGISVTKPETTVNGNPIYFKDGDGNIERTATLLEFIEYSKSVSNL